MMANSVDILAFLGIDITGSTKRLAREAKLAGIFAGDFSEEKIKDILHAGIGADIEEAQAESTGTRAIIIKKDGSGKKWGIKNVWLNRKALLDALIDLGEFIFGLSLISLIRVIKDLFELLQISLSSDEVFIFWTIYRASKQEYVSGDNYIGLIQKASADEHYDELSEKEIEKIVNRLVQIDMLKKQDGNYVVTEKMVVQWL